jgi:hypothetical protein
VGQALKSNGAAGVDGGDEESLELDDTDARAVYAFLGGLAPRDSDR